MSDNKPEDEHPPNTELVKKIKESFLDPMLWLPILEEELGIKNVQSLENIQTEDFLKIEKHIQHPWEERALLKLFNRPDCSLGIAKVQENRNLLIKERYEKAVNVLECLKALHSKGKTRQDEDVKQHEREMWRALEILAQCKVPQEKSLSELIEYFEKEIIFRNESFTNLTDAEVIRHASEGLALEGIFQTKIMEDVAGKREPVLCVPENVRLAGPEQSRVVQLKDFISPKEEYDFQKTAKGLGLNLRSSVFVYFMVPGLKGSSAHSNSSEGEHASQHNYVCATRYNYIPVASCYIRRDQLKLSPSALNALKDIEKAIFEHTRKEDLARKCKDFFHRFGSHVFSGPIHFGGIFWLKVSMKVDDLNHIEKAKKATSDALHSYMGDICAVSGEDNDFLLAAQRFVDFSKTSNIQEDIHVSIAKTGGPAKAASFLQWKSGLVDRNKTWCVIDRGSQLVPIWTVIKDNHESDFTDNSKLASCLSNHYDLEIDHAPEENPDFFLERVKKFLQEVEFWNVDTAEGHLDALTDLKQEIIEKTGTYNIWKNICLANKKLQTFLIKVVQKYKNNPAKDSDLIRTSLKALLDPHIFFVENFPNVIFIMIWIHGSENDHHDENSEFDFEKFMQVLNNVVKELKVNSHLHLTKDDQYRATIKINCSLNSVLNALRKKNDLVEELLMLCIAINFGYSTENNNFQFFQNLLGYEEVEILRIHMQETYNEFLKIRYKCTKRAQAFVLYAGLTLGPYMMSLEWKAQRLDFMKKHLGNSLYRDIHEIIGQPSTQKEWNKLEHDLEVYIYGTDTDKDISWLLQKLDLEKYYPQKMKMMDFHKIGQSYLAEKNESEVTELPLNYLQKLLMLDYTAKYVQCAQSSHPTAEADGGEDVIDNFLHGNMQEYEQENEQAIHPMDVQMSVFLCADDFMRQYLYSKLSFCQFALPLLIPLPNAKSIEFPLWSFQQIKKNWKMKCERDTYYDKFIKETKTHIISFIRLGQSSFSKSQLMNWLISKKRHDIFFHRNCSGSTENALLMNGVTEIAWYFPGGRENDLFDDCIAFINLHGDAKEHDRQVKFLEEISSVIVIIHSELDQGREEVLQQLKKSTKPIIFLLADKTREQERKEKYLPGTGPKENIGLKNRNEAGLIQKVSQTIQTVLSISNEKYSLDTCGDIARKHGFKVDEDKQQCSQGKEQAQFLMSMLKEKDLLDRTEAFLPLQGELWFEWCEKDKEMARLKQKSNVSIEQHRSNILSEKRAIRNKQLERAFPLNDFMNHFLGSLRPANQGLNLHFLEWLKMYLDELSSKSLSGLQENYHNKWTIIKEEKEKKANKVTIESLNNDLEKLSKEIERSRFGFEHILRELGQIYEASETSPGNENDYITLPKIAADLMVSGYPIELMDGDTAHVPQKWIGAILDELVEILGDKKLYVLTVLGIQSTGKSTLLNAMFGLQFAVSAGRCTRGAFMQLIKVDEQLRKELGFDYVLVVDTEGLKAVEVSKKTTINHDNELATFVIGLGNLSLINVFGENPSEMQDILQIAVQAFLRMKTVALRPSCVFVHQNVGEVTAREKNLEGRRKLQEKLDEMVVCAAQQEQCDVTCFNDIIKFDVNAHIHYFAHLWEGDPPMAPPNPSYSQNVQKLRQVILESAKQEGKKNILSISTFKARLIDLWNALLNENFVFSFKNSLEIAIYNKVEVKYSQWTWTLRECMLTIQNQTINQIHNNEFTEENIKLLWKQFDPSYKEILRNFEGFFDDEKDKETLVQWKENIRNRLTRVRDDLIEEVKKKADQMIKSKKIYEKMNNFIEKYEDEVLTEIRNLALSLKGKDIPEEELQQRFDKLWTSLIIKVKKEKYTLVKPAIYTDLEDVFLEGFKNEANISDTIKESYIWKNLEEEVSKYILNKHKLFRESLSRGDLKTIQHTTEILEVRIDEFLKQKERDKMDYQSVYFHEILNMLKSEIRNGLEKFKFRRDYTLIVSLFLCHKAAKRFDKMSENFRIANDPVVYLSNRKDEFWQSFKITCQVKIEIALMANFLCSKLKEAIQEGVYEKSATDLAKNIKSQHRALNGNKLKLDLHLLVSLAEKENFSHYVNYIRDPKSGVNYFIEECVVQFFDENTKVSEILNHNLEHFRNVTLNAIDTSARLVGRNDNVSKWLNTFCSQLGSEVKLSSNDLKSVKYQNISDMEFLKKAMTQALEILVKELRDFFYWCDLKDLKKKVSRILSDPEQLCGCQKRCPFCGAVCTNSIPHHDGDHSVTFHRPQALIGWYYGNSKEFVVEICSSQVAGDGKFELEDGRSIPYKKFKTAGGRYSRWSITPDNSPLFYWKWVTHRFREELEQHYALEFTKRGKIPTQWHSITKKDAIEELEKYLARNRELY